MLTESDIVALREKNSILRTLVVYWPYLLNPFIYRTYFLAIHYVIN